MKLYAKPTPQENARCKVCFKKFQPQEFFRLCTICERKVCEDCSASYTNKEPEVSITSTLFRKKRFMIDEMIQPNAFAIFLEYENPQKSKSNWFL